MASKASFSPHLLIIGPILWLSLSACGSQRHLGHVLVLENQCAGPVQVHIDGPENETTAVHDMTLAVGAHATLAAFDAISDSFLTQVSKDFRFTVSRGQHAKSFTRTELSALLSKTKALHQGSIREWRMSGPAYCPDD